MKALFKLLLKGSLVSAIAMATATGCGDDSSDDDGDGGEGNSGGSAAGTKNTSGSAGEDSTDGGTSTGTGGTDAQGGQTTGVGGTSGGSGAGEGGATTDAGGAGTDPFGGAASGGAGNEYMGPAIAKFCNTLTFDPDGAGGEGGASPQPTTMRLEIGVGNEKVTFTAATDECVPADGAACTEVPTGAAVLVNLFDVDDDTVPIDFATIDIAENDQLIFYTDVDNNAPIWNVRGLNPGFMCEEVTYDDVLAIE
jgi:hypothetical protein